MSPRDRDLRELLEHRLHRRHRLDRRRRRRRAGTLLGAAIAAIAAVAILAGFGAGTALSVSCDLGSLRAIEIGQNSFVYAADGTLLGSIPAERNREPVGLRRIAHWLPAASVAIEDRRFYQHPGVDPIRAVGAVFSNLRGDSNTCRARRPLRSRSLNIS